MDAAKTKFESITGSVGATGAIVAACAACCVSIPVVGPLLAWLGLSGIGAVATGWYLPVAGVSALGLGIFLLARHRRRLTQRPSHRADGCGSRKLNQERL